MRKLKWMTCCVLLSLSAPLMAQTPAPAAATTPTPHQLELATAMMKAQRMDQQIALMVDAIVQGQKAGLDAVRQSPDVLKLEKEHPGAFDTLANSQLNELRQFMTSMLTKVFAFMPQSVAAIYSEADMQAITAFYLSPAGQLALDKQPILAAEMQKKTTAILKAELPKLFETLKIQMANKIRALQTAPQKP